MVYSLTPQRSSPPQIPSKYTSFLSLLNEQISKKNEIEENQVNQNRTKQTEKKNLKKEPKKHVDTEMHAYKQESHRNTKLEAIIYT